MKKCFVFLSVVAVSLAAVLSCDKYDDSELRSEVDALKDKVDELQKSVDAYKLLVEKSKLIESVTLNDDGSYTITFVDGTKPVVIAPQSQGGADADAFFQSVEYDPDNETLTLVLTSGQTVVINLRQPGPGGPGGEDGPGGPGGEDGPDGPGGGGQQEGITLVDRTGTWNGEIYPYNGVNYLYIWTATGNYSFYGVKEDAGDFTDENFLKTVLGEFQQGLTQAIQKAGGLEIKTAQYSYGEYVVINLATGYASKTEAIARKDGGDGNYKVIMFGVDDNGTLTGEYLVLANSYTVSQPVVAANPQDDLTYAVTNMAGTWSAQYNDNYEYVFSPIDGSWFAFYAVPSSLDLTDTAVVGPILKEYEGLIKANYAGKTVTPKSAYASSGSFNVYALAAASYTDHGTIFPAQEGASGELKVLLIGLKSDLSVSGRYVECTGTITR